MFRKRCFQEGTLFKRGTRKKVWVGRWWEDVIGPDNQLARMRRSVVLGTVAEIPTVREARQMLSDLLRKVNSGSIVRNRHGCFAVLWKIAGSPTCFPR